MGSVGYRPPADKHIEEVLTVTDTLSDARWRDIQPVLGSTMTASHDTTAVDVNTVIPPLTTSPPFSVKSSRDVLRVSGTSVLGDTLGVGEVDDDRDKDGVGGGDFDNDGADERDGVGDDVLEMVRLNDAVVEGCNEVDWGSDNELVGLLLT